MRVYDLGLVPYERSLEMQDTVFSLVKSGEISSGLVICRHEPVITLGRSAHPGNILAGASVLAHRGIQVKHCRRGGDVTYHGPGQLVFYPVFRLERFGRDVNKLLRSLEQVVIDSLAAFGIRAGRLDGRTGVWVGDKKISSIGVAVRHWICFHGMAVNVSAQDLENFSCIRPCGMDIAMTSMETVLGRPVVFEAVADEITRRIINDERYRA